MSVYTTQTFVCPECGEALEYDSFDSINADRRPDLREEILAASLSVAHCAACDKDFRPEPDLNYLDFENGLWVLAQPIYNISIWNTEEQKATELFAGAYGANAPASAQEIGDALSPRLTFGWAGFREKLVLKEAGLDDLTMEKTKMAILANRPGNPVEAGVELRLLQARERVFLMAWTNALTGEHQQQFEIQRGLYESVAESEDWGEIDAKLQGTLFLDIQRMFIEPEDPPSE